MGSPFKQSSDSESFRELKILIETLTHTGEKTLDPPILKQITKMCKSSNQYIIHAYHLLVEKMDANHSEIRYSAFQICIELFKRSHCFRELLVANMQHIMASAAETDPFRPMPPPRSAAIALKKLALATIQDWSKQYGSGYKKLHLAISFLKNCKKIDFNAMAQEEAAEQSRQTELLRRKKSLQNERFKRVVDEIKDQQPDIVNNITELENCIALLLPKPEDFFLDDETPTVVKPQTEKQQSLKLKERDKIKENVAEDEGSTEENDSDDDVQMNELQTKEPVFDFRKYGILNPHFSITLNLDPGVDPVIKKTDENASIIESAQDSYKLFCNRFQPLLEKWETILAKCTDLEDTITNDVVKKVADLKIRSQAIIEKYHRLNLQAVQLNRSRDESDESDSSDSDFEEVQNKEGYEAYSKSAPVTAIKESSDTPIEKKQATRKPKTTKKDWSLISEDNHVKDPTSALSTLSTLSSKATCEQITSPNPPPSVSTKTCQPSDTKEDEPKPGPSGEQKRKAKLLAVAPIVPFDVDLYHWEEENLEAPTRFTVKPDGHRFWVSTAEDQDELRDPDGEASIRTRVIEFSGDFQPVKWTCRAPLPSGKLCPRRDRVKCPFHGKVIGRDKDGKPTSPEDQQAEKEREEAEKAKEVPDWQDPKLLAELKESTGVDLRMPDRSKRGWRKKLPGQLEEKKYVGLTDIKASQNTTYNRLSKKIFQKSSMRRVAADMDRLDRKRFRDKYGDQFNYMFN